MTETDLKAENEKLKAMVATLTEAVVIADSYGVPGSEFHTCLACSAGGAPGVPFKHTDWCPVGKAEDTAERWFREQREEIEYWEIENARLREALAPCTDWLRYAYGNVSSVTADRVKEHLPAIEAALRG